MTYSPTCSRCGAALYRDDVHCPRCGLRRPDSVLEAAPTFGATRLVAATGLDGEGKPRTCPECGTALLDDDAFCASCGTGINPASPPPDWAQETQLAPEPEGQEELAEEIDPSTHGADAGHGQPGEQPDGPLLR